MPALRELEFDFVAERDTDMIKSLTKLTRINGLTVTEFWTYGGDNPYRRCNVGDWIEFETQAILNRGMAGSAHSKYTVVKKSDREVVIETVTKGDDPKMKEQKEQTSVDFSKPFRSLQILDVANGRVLGSKAEDFSVNGKVLKTVKTMIESQLVEKNKPIKVVVTQNISMEVPLEGLVYSERTQTSGNHEDSKFITRVLKFGFGPKKAAADK